MAEPKLRFTRDDGSSYPEWRMQSVGDLTVELSDYKPLNSGLPLLTSARTGLMFQDEYRSKSSTDNDETLFSVVPRGAVTYRHMSDDNVFHFNINDLVDAGLVSKEYPVFNTVNGNNVRLLVEYLNSSKAFLEFCKAQKKGGTRTRLYFKVLKDYELMFPCFEEQQKIADFLSSVDEVIAFSEQEVANLETQKKAVMKKIFSQEVRFKKEDGSDFPEWEDKTLGEVCEFIRNGFTYNADGLRNHRNLITRIETISSGVIDKARLGSTDSNVPEKYLLHDGDILFSHINSLANLGKTAIFDICFGKVYHGMNLLCIRPSKELIMPFYLLSLLRSPITSTWIIEHAKRAVNQCSIPTSELKNMVVAIPHLEEQRQIADFLSTFDEAIVAAKRELALWKELKKALLQQMFV